MEKCILYISELPKDQHGISVPVGLSNIFTTAQRMNADFGVSGMLTYKSGYYLQILEGEGARVDQLYRNILKDDRHHNPLKIVDVEIGQRSFSGGSMRLIVPVSSNQEFAHFIHRMKPSLKEVPSPRLELLRIFVPSLFMSDTGSTEPPKPMLVKAGVEYEKWDYRLIGWPNFAGVDIGVAIIGICARLVRQRSSYRALLASDPSMKPEKLDNILDMLNRTGMLRISAPVHGSAQAKYPAAGPRPSTRDMPKTARGSRGFLNKLKGLIDNRLS